MRFEDFLNEIRLIRSFLMVGISFEQALAIISKRFKDSFSSQIIKSEKSIRETLEEIMKKEKNKKVKYCLEKIKEGLELETLGENLDLIIEKYSEEEREISKSKIEFSKTFSTFFLIVSIIAPIILFTLYAFLSTLSSLEFLNLSINIDENFIYFSIFLIFLVEALMMFYFFKRC
ncbi:MAG: hypothetical protein QW641_00535 [Candidatus Aenigmatarchaeota archaeon]